MMGENRLTRTDLDVIAQVKAGFLQHLGRGTLMQYAVDTLAEVIDSIFVSYQAIDRQGKMLGGVHYPREDVEALHMIPLINEYLTENPCLSSLMSGEPGHLTAVMTSDFVTQEEFGKTNLFQKAYKQLGWYYQLQVSLWDNSGLLHSIAFNRKNHDFSERDREMAKHLIPAFLKALRSNSLIDERLNQLRLGVALTNREGEILHWIAEGKSNPEIAAIIGVSKRTVDTHCTNLFKKLGFENRAAAVKFVSVTKRLTFNARD